MTSSSSGASSCLSRMEKAEIRQAFCLFDTEGKGTINVAELRDILKSLDVDDDVHNGVAATFLQHLQEYQQDDMKKSTLTLEEFEKLVMRNKGNANDLKHVFGLFDVDDKGYITKENLQSIANSLGEELSPAEVQEMMDRASSNGKRVTFQEFHDIMTKQLFPTS